jgi:hypothetical protein
LHELVPLHITSHSLFFAHWISSWQDMSPVHWMSHDEDIVQMILWVHEPFPHRTRHGRFAGHCTSVVVHEPCALQSITQTPSASHVPLEQPWAQSCCAVVSASGVGGVGLSMPESIMIGLPPLSHSTLGDTHQPPWHCCPPVHSVAAEHSTVQSIVLGW